VGAKTCICKTNLFGFQTVYVFTLYYIYTASLMKEWKSSMLVTHQSKNLLKVTRTGH